MRIVGLFFFMLEWRYCFELVFSFFIFGDGLWLSFSVSEFIVLCRTFFCFFISGGCWFRGGCWGGFLRCFIFFVGRIFSFISGYIGEKY